MQIIHVCLHHECLTLSLSLESDAKLSEMDVFNEACAVRLATQFKATRSRGRRELDQLTGSTEFTRDELKLLYWGWKCSCLSGSLTESTFKGEMSTSLLCLCVCA